MDKKKINKTIREYGKDILSSKNFKSSHNNIQHGTITVMRHSIDVARASLRIADALKIKVKKKDLVRGALLHDFFLYDWHVGNGVDNQKLHGFFHPGIALRNAEKEFDLTRREREIIKKHMWPLTPIPPRCKEAWIVTLADKYCSLLETLKIRK